MANRYEYVRRSIKRRRDWLNSFKSKPCEDCGGKFPPFVMDWHHRDPKEKSFPVSAGSFRHSKRSILAEMAKCVLLCANCHRIREYAARYDPPLALPLELNLDHLPA